MTRDVRVRTAREDERDTVANVLDGALLEIDPVRLGDAIDADDVLVASDEGSIVGALVLDDGHVEAVAVRRVRRNRGIGSALVNEATSRVERVTADFDARAKPFYDALGFSVDARGDGRYRGAREGDERATRDEKRRE